MYYAYTTHMFKETYIHNVTWYTIKGSAEQPNNKVNDLRK